MARCRLRDRATSPERHPDDDDLADKYEMADELLERAGLANYEVSNWALPGEECRHNVLYWQQGDYAGFGSAAHSHRGGRRRWKTCESVAKIIHGKPAIGR